MRSWLIWIFLGLSIVWVIAHQFLLQIPAKGEWQYNIGILFQGLSLSYIAAFIFYLVHNFAPFFRFQKKIEPLINREMNDLWEVCNDLSHMMRTYSGVSAYKTAPYNFQESVPEQIRELPVEPVLPANRGKTVTKGNAYPIPSDPDFDKKNKPITIGVNDFDKWSEAIEYVSVNTSKSLELIIGFKDFVDVETIMKLSLLQKSLNDFQTVAHLYEKQKQKTFQNGYLEKQMVEFYNSLEALAKYKEKHKKSKNKENN